ncbi:unnamed protein product [Allacma fusca]|uniref:Uncharacterized protein n=1 Tax=Allacma fusca TaxID=39272 RepID=A0A8J2L7X6_9HEXA|nr:unnamed protein product [Allacma fusca]
MDLFDKYCQKTVRVISKSHDLKSTKENPVTHANFLIDFDDLKFDQITDPQTLAYVLHLAVEHRDIITLHAHKVIVINSKEFFKLY